jgi:hypothetical protein
MTRPFLCRSGGETYYVKGAYAGLRSVCCEWVAGRLVNLLLPAGEIGIPQISLAEVPRELIQGCDRDDAKDLGEGWGFASKRIQNAQELTWTAAQRISENVMATVLLLDLWLQNEDRSLSDLGGNPNLLMTFRANSGGPEANSDHLPNERLWVFDFNLAFDEAFNRKNFFANHVFGGLLNGWPSGFRELMAPRLQQAWSKLPEIFAELPLECLHIDGDVTLPVQLSMDRVSSCLALPFSDPESFWKLP